MLAENCLNAKVHCIQITNLSMGQLFSVGINSYCEFLALHFCRCIGWLWDGIEWNGQSEKFFSYAARARTTDHLNSFWFHFNRLNTTENTYTTHTNFIDIFADETLEYLVKCGQTLVNPMNNVWYPVCQKTYFNWHDDLLTITYQVLPSLAMDLFSKSPTYKLMPFVRKIMAMAEVIKFFNHNNFVFANRNFFNVIDR